MWLEVLDQTIILLTGPTSIWLVNDNRQSYQKWGCLLAFISQPFWLHAAWIAGQWGIFFTDLLYSWAWWKGFKKHWIKGGQ